MSAAVWRRVSLALGVVLALLLIALVLVLVRGNRVLPWTTASERQTQRYDVATRAATRAVLAFIDVDYRHVDADLKRMTDLSTGAFKSQWSATTTDIKATTQQAKAIRTGTVKYAALNSISDTRAVVLVGADTVVKNTSTVKQKKTAACPHSGASCNIYRFAVQLTRTAGGWKMSNLTGVS